MSFPRILLLTVWAPDTKYKVIRRILERMPPERLCWASLGACRADPGLPFPHQAFPPRRLHWRLHNTALDLLYAQEIQSDAIAARIAEWARPFRPEVIWVLSEWGAAHTGYHLWEHLKVPLHVTIHDAYETARFLVPLLYYPVYMRSLHRITRHAASLDAISDELLRHCARRYPNITPANSMAFAPSVLPSLMADPDARRVPDMGGSSPRRIGFCGASRVTSRQWKAFLAVLGGLPFPVEVIAFANQDLFHAVGLPQNVTIAHRPFAETEADVIRAFHQAGVHACYLGLYKEPNRRLFGATSLSAKLTTYAAAGLPVVVDGPAQSVAWRLVRQYDSGVLCGDDRAAAVRDLSALLSDPPTWKRMARGSARMCRQEFDLTANAARLGSLLAATAAAAGASTTQSP